MSEHQTGLAHKKTLVLNADGMPIAIVPWWKAIGMIHVKNTAILIDSYTRPVVDAKGREYDLPAVVVLKKMVKRNNQKVPFNRKNVLLRDKLTCCYCGIRFLPKDLTYDHVIPRCKWSDDHARKTGHLSVTNWENIVTACKKCNTRKGGRTPEEAGMKLLKKPRKPTRAEVSMKVSVWERIPQEWSPYMVSINSLASEHQ